MVHIKLLKQQKTKKKCVYLKIIIRVMKAAVRKCYPAWLIHIRKAFSTWETEVLLCSKSDNFGIWWRPTPSCTYLTTFWVPKNKNGCYFCFHKCPYPVLSRFKKNTEYIWHYKVGLLHHFHYRIWIVWWWL